ncbi:unnamed protein product [Dibothriocephalus latus]|uniref:Uncharacterized protein n=1 Tax=Dibothriocephalus latus TaxID=60516 RepID=A0A3P7LVB6_DIBLA|nr:unnamed protein product [Dibothriocephalus latus]
MTRLTEFNHSQVTIAMHQFWQKPCRLRSTIVLQIYLEVLALEYGCSVEEEEETEEEEAITGDIAFYPSYIGH